MNQQRRQLGVAVAMFIGLCYCAVNRGQELRALTADERQGIEQGQRTLRDALAAMTDRPQEELADAGIFLKGLDWALRYDREFSTQDVVLLQKAVARGRERVFWLRAGTMPWDKRKGKLVRGFVSRVDHAVQPYGLIVPSDYDPQRPTRLDVVLHGSTRPVGLSELRFMARFDEGDGENASPPDQSFIELHPLGRVENCYRWAGETDVFEAIADVCGRYNIDRQRIVLRGMSMGASGTWHLGLKYPDQFVAIGPYCGYVDTHRFSETPLDNFVKVGPLPPHQERALHMLDSVDYAANAGIVPAIACMGEKDVFFQAHVLMGEAMQREGLTMVNLISPGTGHVIDPKTHAEQMRRIGEYAAKGLDHHPPDIRFVTWTLKYSRCHWLQVLGLDRHYDRAEIAAHWRNDGVEITELKNIHRFAILTSLLPAAPRRIQIGMTEFIVPDALRNTSKGIVVARRDAKWEIAGELGAVSLRGKRPGLQGPIDDAFTTPFVCVRGTGKPWNAAAQAYADASLKRFANDWQHYFRGELPVKNDVDITADDVRSRNLILFGDPGSNSWIAKSLAGLPLSWSKESFRLGGEEYSASDHAPVLIAPNPLEGAADHYVVVNSGHTFHEAELGKLNYLLFPRWGDWAVMELDATATGANPLEDKVVRAGFFDEQWAEAK